MTFGTGLDSFQHGWRLASSRSLRRFVWLPMALSFVLIVGLFAVATVWVQNGLAMALEWLPDALGWLAQALLPLVYVLGVVVAAWLFGLLAVLAASPFLGALSARAEQEAFGNVPDGDTGIAAALESGSFLGAPSARAEQGAFGNAPDGDTGIAVALANTLRREARKIAYYLPRLLGLFLLGFVPVANLVAPLLWFLFGAWMLAVQFVDYAAENRSLEFAETLALLRANRAAALGFGALATLLLAVPLAALLVIPAAACGGAVLWRRLA